jgi:hypothetical protein
MEKKGGPVLSDPLQAIKGTQSNAIKSVPLIETGEGMPYEINIYGSKTLKTK